MKKIKAYLFPSIMLITSLAMAGIAAYISVSGLAKLFAGAGATVLLMTGIIEFSKVVITTYLHKSDYSRKNLLLNIPLTIATVVIMGVTSLGVYGFLANGYTVTAGHLDKNKGQVEILESKIKTFNTKIEGLEIRKKNNSSRSNKLTDLRAQQETRIDSLYKKGWYRSARKVESQVAESNEEIQKLMNKNAESDSLIQVENEKIGEIRNQIIDLNNSDVNAELGPLKYISNITGLNMDNVINYIILVLIFIFDPTAVLMLVAANHMFDKAKKKLYEKGTSEPELKDEEKIVSFAKEVEESVPFIKSDAKKGEVNYIPYEYKYPSPVISGATMENVEATDPSSAETESIKESIEEVLLTGTTGYSELSSESSEEKTDLEEKTEKFFEEKEKKKEEFIEMVEEKNKEFTKELSAEYTGSTKEDQVDLINSIVSGSAEVFSGSSKLGGENIIDAVQDILEEELNPDYKETLYVNLAKTLFKDGEIKKGERFDSYDDFILKCRENNIVSPEKVIRDFVTTCVLLKIIVDDDEGYKVANKTLDQSLKLILLVEE